MADRLCVSPPVCRRRPLCVYRAAGHAALCAGRLTALVLFSLWWARPPRQVFSLARAGGTRALRVGPVVLVWQGRGRR